MDPDLRSRALIAADLGNAVTEAVAQLERLANTAPITVEAIVDYCLTQELTDLDRQRITRALWSATTY
jgi:hypothetical protein